MHHTNEIAQTEACHGTRLDNFCLHGHFLQLDDAKMAKSAGDFLRLQTLDVDGTRLRPSDVSLLLPERSLSGATKVYVGQPRRCSNCAAMLTLAAQSWGLQARRTRDIWRGSRNRSMTT